MKRMNIYFPGEILPPGAKWIVTDMLGGLSFIDSTPDQAGRVIEGGRIAVLPTRHKRPNRKRGFVATVWAKARKKAGWVDKIRGKIPEITETMSEI